MYCVIVGDIINSKEIGFEAREAVNQSIQQTFDRINAAYAGAMMAGLDTVRGDGFECVLLAQAMAPRIIMEIIKSFYAAEGTKVRVSVVLGELVTSSANVNQADGPAFHRANLELERLKARKSDGWLQVRMQTDSIAQPLIDGTLELLTALTGGWTDKQREIVWAMEAFSGQKSLVAAHLDKSVTVINKQLRSANYDAYRTAWDALEEYLSRLEEAVVAPEKPCRESYTAFFGVGQRRLRQERYDDAIVLFQRALELAREELGGSDRELVAIYNALSQAYLNRDRLTEAKTMIDASFRLQEPLPTARLELAQTIIYHGIYLSQTGRNTEANAEYDRALDICVSLVGEYHPYVRACYHNIGMAYFRMGEYHRAIHYLRKGLDVLNHNPEPNRLAIAETTNCIGLAYGGLGNYPKALDELEKALQGYGAMLSPKDKRVAELKEDIGAYQAKLNPVSVEV